MIHTASPMLKPFSDALILIGLMITGAALGCVDPATSSDDPVKITEITPTACPPGGAISLNGSGFGIQGVEDRVTLSGETLEVLYWSTERIDLRVPPQVSPGAKVLMVSAGRYVSAPLPFTVLDPGLRELFDAGQEEGLDMDFSRIRDQEPSDAESNTEPTQPDTAPFDD